MADQGNKFSFFQDIHVKIDIRNDISISILQNLASRYVDVSIMRCISNETKQDSDCDVIMSRSCDKLKSLYFYYQGLYDHL